MNKRIKLIRMVFFEASQSERAFLKKIAGNLKYLDGLRVRLAGLSIAVYTD